MRRRDLLKSGWPRLSCRSAAASWAAAADGGPKRLIVILLRGAVDGLNVVVPYAEEAYYQERRSIAIAPPGKPDGALALDGAFRAAPGSREPDAAVDRAQPRLYPCRRLARPDPFAFRRAALYRERHAGTEHDPGRLDEPAAVGAPRSARPDRRDQHRPDLCRASWRARRRSPICRSAPTAAKPLPIDRPDIGRRVRSALCGR